jgi:ketosteroid isomerase-like protein
VADNTALVRAGFAAQEQGDLEPIRELIDPDAPIHVPESVPLADLRGLDGIAALLMEMVARADGGFHSHFLDAVGAGDIVTAVNEVTATRGAKTLRYNTVWTFRFLDGKVAEAWLLPSLPVEQVAAFYGWAA